MHLPITGRCSLGVSACTARCTCRRRTCNVTRVFDNRSHHLRISLANRIPQGFFNVVEVDFFEQQLDRLDRIAVDRQVERAATHVVETVDVQRHVVRVAERLSNYRQISESCSVQVDSFLVGELPADSLTMTYYWLYTVSGRSITN